MSIAQIIDEFEMHRNTKKSQPEKLLLKRKKLNPRKEKIGTGIKILNPNKLLTKLPVLFAQIKTGNNS